MPHVSLGDFGASMDSDPTLCVIYAEYLLLEFLGTSSISNLGSYI